MYETFRSLSPHTRKLLIVAELYSQGHPEKWIVDFLKDTDYHMAAGACSKLVREAKEKQLIMTVLNVDLMSEEVLKSIRIITSEYPELEKKLKMLTTGRALRNLRVYYSGQEGVSSEQWDERLAYFSQQASGHILELLQGAKMIGVGWGHTVSATVTALERYPNSIAKQSKNHEISFVPTCGEPLGRGGHPDRASSELVARLSAVWGCRSNPLSLAGVSIVLPGNFTDAEKDVVRRFITEIRDYKRIFGPVEKADAVPLIEQIDTFITSVGSLSQGWQTYQAELIGVGGISREKVREVALGDIDGALIRRSNLSLPQQENFRRINESWTGITLEQCKSIASRAVKSDKPGVLVVAIGGNKAKTIIEVVRQGLVNELIIDHDLARALNEALPKGVETNKRG